MTKNLLFTNCEILVFFTISSSELLSLSCKDTTEFNRTLPFGVFHPSLVTTDTWFFIGPLKFEQDSVFKRVPDRTCV